MFLPHSGTISSPLVRLFDSATLEFSVAMPKKGQEDKYTICPHQVSPRCFRDVNLSGTFTSRRSRPGDVYVQS